MFADYLHDFRDATIAYHAFDLFSAIGVWGEKQCAAEARVVAAADLVVAVSPGIVDILGQRYDREDIRWLPNGADVASFRRGASDAIAADLAKIPPPRIAYVGRINQKVDFRLLHTLASRLPKLSFVLVGPIQSLDGDSATNLVACTQLSNFYHIDERPHWQLPAYTGHMDVNLMCYRTDSAEWMKFAYP